MKIEDQVCTAEQSKKLKAFGVKQISWFCYDDRSNKLSHNVSSFSPQEWDYNYAAFTAAELGVMLPQSTSNGVITTFKDDEIGYWYFMYCNLNGIIMDYVPAAKTEAQLRAAMLIHLLENKSITVEEINRRLSKCN